MKLISRTDGDDEQEGRKEEGELFNLFHGLGLSGR